MDASAEQFVHGFVDGLADDIPARHLDPAEHADQRDVRPLRITATVHAVPEVLDVERVGADHMPLGDVLDHALHRRRPEGGVVDLANALDTVIRGELHENEVAPAEIRRGIAYHDRPHVRDLHDSLLSRSPDGVTPPGQPCAQGARRASTLHALRKR